MVKYCLGRRAKFDKMERSFRANKQEERYAIESV